MTCEGLPWSTAMPEIWDADTRIASPLQSVATRREWHYIMGPRQIASPKTGTRGEPSITSRMPGNRVGKIWLLLGPYHTMKGQKAFPPAW